LEILDQPFFGIALGGAKVVIDDVTYHIVHIEKEVVKTPELWCAVWSRSICGTLVPKTSTAAVRASEVEAVRECLRCVPDVAQTTPKSKILQFPKSSSFEEAVS
jgi:hypothetical protein